MVRRLIVLATAMVAVGSLVSFLSPDTSSAVAQGPGRGLAYVPGQVLVGYKAGASPAARTFAVARVNGRPLESIHTESMKVAGHRPVLLIDVGMSVEDAIEVLKSDPNVEYAEPNWIVTTQGSNDPYYTSGNLWGMYGDQTVPTNQFGSQAGEAWAAGTTGSAKVVVGVIDEGIDVNHVDLRGNIWVNPYDPVNGVDDDGNGYIDDVNGWDFANNDRTVYDGGNQDKHGTHVAGTIGATGNNGTGVSGVNWSVTMISLKFLGRNGGTIANAVKAVDYLTGLKTLHGMNIVASNNSWGGGGYSTALFNAIERARAADILFVAAAGNGGNDGVGDNNDATPSYPSSYTNANVIAVASITSTGAKSGFSNYGATSVDLGAPGSSILSTLPKNTYGSYSGTSMASPHVAGAVALYAAANPGASAATIKAAIMGSTVPTPSMGGRTVSGGRLNVSGF